MKPKDVTWRAERPGDYQGRGISRPPTYSGTGGQVWTLEIANTADRVATVGIWILRCGVNPLFDYVAAILLHLRPIAGVPDADKWAPDREYDFYMFGLDPQNPLPDLEKIESSQKHMKPQIYTYGVAEIAAQFSSVGGDAQAFLLVDDTMLAIAQGHVVPDTDYRVAWGHALTQRIIERTTRPVERTN